MPAEHTADARIKIQHRPVPSSIEKKNAVTSALSPWLGHQKQWLCFLCFQGEGSKTQNHMSRARGHCITQSERLKRNAPGTPRKPKNPLENGSLRNTSSQRTFCEKKERCSLARLAKCCSLDLSFLEQQGNAAISATSPQPSLALVWVSISSVKCT